MLGKILKDALSGRDKTQAAENRSFLPMYEKHFAPLLAGRTEGFRTIFKALEARCLTLDRPALIVETGSLRQPGNWAGDGQSTILWREFSCVHPCELHTVDLDPEAAKVVRELCGDGEDLHVHTGDSVAFLYEMAKGDNPPQIDMLYLDSFDFDIDDPFPSAFHHIKELIAARPCLRKGSIIAIDDNFILPDGKMTGKGYLAIQWFEHLNIPCMYQGHQYVWQL